MGSRKAYSYGIPEYPWSSDDDEDETPAEPRASAAVLPRPSASGRQATPSTSALSPGMSEAARADRDICWSMLNKGTVPPPSPTYSNNRSRSGDTPLAYMPRTTHTPVPEMAQRWLNRNQNNIQTVLAFKRLTKNLNLQGGRANRYTIPRTSASSSNPGTTVPSEATSSTSQVKRARDTASAGPSTGYHPRSTSLSLLSALGSSRDARADRARRNWRRMNMLFEEKAPRASTSHAANAAADATEATDSADAVDDQHADNETGVVEPEVSSNDTSHTSASLEEVVEIPDETPPALDPAVVDLIQYEDTAAVVPSSSDPNLASTSRADETDAPELAHQHHGVKRKRRESTDDSRGEPSTVKEFNQKLLRLLECPVCLEWMEPPMSQCRRGHLVCPRCRVRLATCPVCRTTFSSVRNRAMEGLAELLRFPCRHGCGREVHLRRRASHEASCPSRKYACPAPACADKPGHPRAQLAEHFHAKHLNLVKLGCTHKLSLRVNTEHHDNYMIMALEQCFHLKVDVDIRTWGVIVYVSYIGPKCYSQDYAYEVIIEGENNNRRLSYKRATHSDLENTSLSVSRQDCFHLTLDQTLNFIRFKGRNSDSERYLDFSVEVSKNDPPPSRYDSDS